MIRYHLRHQVLFALIALTLSSTHVCGVPVAPPNAAGLTSSAPHAPVHWQDLSGRDYTLTSTAIKANVFVFASTQCPISNLYIPRLNEMAGTYKGHGIRFFLVDSNPEDTRDKLVAYAAERALTFPIVKDRGTTLADQLAADRTPESIVVDRSGAIVYRGRIDDSVNRAHIVRHDLANALDDVLHGRPIAHPRTIAFGCGIYHDAADAETLRPGGESCVFTRDIAPVLNSHCVGCHREGEVAPFALQTYAEARTWSRAIRDVTARRIMPPWKAVAGGAFCDARGLTDREIGAIARWVSAGTPEGDPQALPAPPQFAPPDAWSLGAPDLVTQPVRPYHLTAEGPDVYRNFVLPVDFAEDRYISAMEFKPGNRAVVHHVVLYIDRTGQSAKMDGKESEPGYTVPGVSIGVIGAEWGEVWVPGRTPRMLPPGVAIKIPAGAKLVMQVHYHKNGAPQTDSTRMALYFAHGTVNQLIRIAPLLNATFDLKPGSAHQDVHAHFVLPVDVHLRTIFPHMHLLGRAMTVTATFPDGTKRDLIAVRDWDFNWQETYVYREPVALPKGTSVDLTAVYDNSDRNPRQPAHPPREVHWGEQTTDEMCLAVVGITIDQERLNVNLTGD